MVGLLKQIHNYYTQLIFKIVIINFLYFSPPLSIFFKDKTNFSRRFAKFGLRIAFFMAGVRVIISGKENIPEGRIIFASNHRSLMDTLAILTFFDRPFFVLTEPFDAMQNKFIVRWTERLGYIPVLRDDKDKKLFRVGMNRHYVVPLSVDRVNKGESLVIYPEAHHERKNKLLKFKTGAVRVALEAKVPLIPVALTGTEHVITPSYYKIHPGKVHIRIGKPMNIGRYYGKHNNRKLVRTLTEQLKKEIKSLIP